MKLNPDVLLTTQRHRSRFDVDIVISAHVGKQSLLRGWWKSLKMVWVMNIPLPLIGDHQYYVSTWRSLKNKLRGRLPCSEQYKGFL